MGEFTSEEGCMGFSIFDAWAARATRREHTKAADIAVADAFLRRLDLNLRTADPINIAIAQRLDAALVTFGERMAANARSLDTRMEAV
jgi:predicted nucleic acid-binding protein